jgi:hypothetical protein
VPNVADDDPVARYVKVVKASNGRYGATHAATAANVLACGTKPHPKATITDITTEPKEATCRSCRNQLGLDDTDDANTTRRAGIGHWHAHEGRHTAVSIMSSNGVPIQEISDTVGYKSTHVTETVYRHVIVPKIRGGATVMDDVFADEEDGDEYNEDDRDIA